MVRRMRDYIGVSASERFVARRVADELKLDDRVAADAIRDVTTGREYSFLVNLHSLFSRHNRVAVSRKFPPQQIICSTVRERVGECIQATLLLLGGEVLRFIES